MKFNILGSSSGIAEKGKNLSSVYVNAGEVHLIIDAGEGLAHSVQAENLDHELLDAVIITHYHPDHVTGLFMLVQSLYIQKRERKLRIFLPERVEEFCRMFTFFYTFPERLSFELDFQNIQNISQVYPFIEICENDHLAQYSDFIKENSYPNPMKCFSVRLNAEGRSLVYTSDIKKISSIQSIIAKTDVCIVDAIHPDIDEIHSLDLSVKNRIILTHGSSVVTDQFVKENPKFVYAEENKIFTV